MFNIVTPDIRMFKFKAPIKIIGINPFVYVPKEILENLFKQSGKTKGHIPVCGTVNDKSYKQTLVKYKKEWRFYVNKNILKDSPKRIGEIIEVTIKFDPEERLVKPHPKLLKALNQDKEAKKVFNSLSRSLQKEIIKYISFLKTEASIDRNVCRAINFLNGKERFIGKDKP